MRLIFLYISFFVGTLVVGGCAHYPPNSFLKESAANKGYRLKNLDRDKKSDSLLLFLTFSGGGTRAASLAFGVLEELARTEIFLEGRKHSLLEEVDAISSVSGGSFTAAYYGLFGRRIFEDFPSHFLKRNVQRELFEEAIPLDNWFRLLSANFGRSDLAAEYYDKLLFAGGTFGDIEARGGPLILVNATDLTLGTYFRVQSGRPWEARGTDYYGNYYRYLEKAGTRHLGTWANLDLIILLHSFRAVPRCGRS